MRPADAAAWSAPTPNGCSERLLVMSWFRTRSRRVAPDPAARRMGVKAVNGEWRMVTGDR